MVKRVDSPYQAGARNFNWVKLKKHSRGALDDTVDCVLLGYFVGRGKRVDLGVGALLVGVYDAEADDFKTVTEIGTGLSDEQWREVAERAEPFRSEHRPRACARPFTPDVSGSNRRSSSKCWPTRSAARRTTRLATPCAFPASSASATPTSAPKTRPPCRSWYRCSTRPSPGHY